MKYPEEIYHERVKVLEAENERLREALVEMFPLTDTRESYEEKYYRAIRIARAALAGKAEQ